MASTLPAMMGLDTALPLKRVCVIAETSALRDIQRAPSPQEAEAVGELLRKLPGLN
jgi:hypothetical protein